MNTTRLRRGISAVATAPLVVGMLLVAGPAPAAPASQQITGSPTADTDGDGISDGDEIDTYQTNPLNQDTDGDGLDDGDEVDGTKNPNYKNGYYRNHPGSTNATTADTDQDVLTDLEEILGLVKTSGSGSTTTPPTDPNDPDTDGDTLTYDDPTLTDSGEVYTYDTDPTVANPVPDPVPVDSDVDGTPDVTETAITQTDPLVATVLNPDTASVAYNAPTQTADAPSVTTTSLLANDAGTTDDTAVTAVVDGTGGAWTLGSDNSVTFAPDPGFYGPATATYLVTSAMQGQVTVTVANPPAPVARADAATTVQNTPVVVDVIANDTINTTGGTVTSAAATSGTATVISNKVRYAPAKNFIGTATATYTVKDRAGGTGTGKLTIKVTPAKPRLRNDGATTRQNKAVTINVLGNDAGPRPRTITKVAGSKGTWRVVAGRVRYAPAKGFTGTATATYTVVSAGGGRATAKITVVVKRAPTAKAGRQSPTQRDSDRDGLTDAQERAGTRYWSRIEGKVHHYKTVTNPHKADTDGDGIDDKAEMSGYQAYVIRPGGKGIFGYARWHVSSNPQRKDTDGDGLRDKGERARRLDARDMNTDGWKHGRPAKDTPQTAEPGVDDNVDRFPHVPCRS